MEFNEKSDFLLGDNLDLKLNPNYSGGKNGVNSSRGENVRKDYGNNNENVDDDNDDDDDDDDAVFNVARNSLHLKNGECNDRHETMNCRSGLTGVSNDDNNDDDNDDEDKGECISPPCRHNINLSSHRRNQFPCTKRPLTEQGFDNTVAGGSNANSIGDCECECESSNDGSKQDHCHNNNTHSHSPSRSTSQPPPGTVCRDSTDVKTQNYQKHSNGIRIKDTIIDNINESKNNDQIDNTEDGYDNDYHVTSQLINNSSDDTKTPTSATIKPLHYYSCDGRDVGNHTKKEKGEFPPAMKAAGTPRNLVRKEILDGVSVSPAAAFSANDDKNNSDWVGNNNHIRLSSPSTPHFNSGSNPHYGNERVKTIGVSDNARPKVKGRKGKLSQLTQGHCQHHKHHHHHHDHQAPSTSSTSADVTTSGACSGVSCKPGGGGPNIIIPKDYPLDCEVEKEGKSRTESVVTTTARPTHNIHSSPTVLTQHTHRPSAFNYDQGDALNCTTKKINNLDVATAKQPDGKSCLFSPHHHSCRIHCCDNDSKDNIDGIKERKGVGEPKLKNVIGDARNFHNNPTRIRGDQGVHLIHTNTDNALLSGLDYNENEDVLIPIECGNDSESISRSACCVVNPSVSRCVLHGDPSSTCVTATVRRDVSGKDLTQEINNTLNSCHDIDTRCIKCGNTFKITTGRNNAYRVISNDKRYNIFPFDESNRVGKDNNNIIDNTDRSGIRDDATFTICNKDQSGDGQDFDPYRNEDADDDKGDNGTDSRVINKQDNNIDTTSNNNNSSLINNCIQPQLIVRCSSSISNNNNNNNNSGIESTPCRTHNSNCNKAPSTIEISCPVCQQRQTCSSGHCDCCGCGCSKSDGWCCRSGGGGDSDSKLKSCFEEGVGEVLGEENSRFRNSESYNNLITHNCDDRCCFNCQTESCVVDSVCVGEEEEEGDEEQEEEDDRCDGETDPLLKNTSSGFNNNNSDCVMMPSSKSYDIGIINKNNNILSSLNSSSFGSDSNNKTKKLQFIDSGVGGGGGGNGNSSNMDFHNSVHHSDMEKNGVIVPGSSDVVANGGGDGCGRNGLEGDGNKSGTSREVALKDVVGAGDDGGDDEDDDAGPCGWGGFHLQCCQRFRSPVWFVVVITIFSSVQGMAINGFVNTVISTLERRFGINSTESGLIASCYDIMFVILVIPVAYFGGHGNKPRYLALGSIVMGLGSFLFCLPHFISDEYEVSSASETVCHTNGTMTSDLYCQKNQTPDLSYFKYFFFFGQMLHGAGATALYTLAAVYVDENVSQRSSSTYNAVFYTGSIVGPAIGYMFGGQLLKFYTDPNVDPDSLGLTVNNPRWVGAWWIGFLISGTLACLLALPLFAFPPALPGARKYAAESGIEAHHQKIVDETGKAKSIRDILLSIRLLLFNIPFMCINLAAATDAAIVSGFSTFLPKFIEYQYGTTAATAALYVGLAVVPAGGGATFLGGYVVTRYNLKLRGILRFCIASAVILIATLFSFLLRCETGQFAGITTLYDTINSTSAVGVGQRLDSSCNSGCSCVEENYYPVCGRDGVMYFSPCYAGCTDVLDDGDVKYYSNCSCISFNLTDADYAAGTTHLAEFGKCDNACKWTVLLMLLTSVQMILIFAKSMPSLTATLRCVPSHQRSFALGIQWIVARCIGSIPGPILFGKMFDESCSLWQKKCEGSGSCFFYDNEQMRVYLAIIATAFAILTAVFFFLANWFYVPKEPDPSVGLEVKIGKSSSQNTVTTDVGSSPPTPGDESVTSPYGS